MICSYICAYVRVQDPTKFIVQLASGHRPTVEWQAPTKALCAAWVQAIGRVRYRNIRLRSKSNAD